MTIPSINLVSSNLFEHLAEYQSAQSRFGLANHHRSEAVPAPLYPALHLVFLCRSAHLSGGVMKLMLGQHI